MMCFLLPFKMIFHILRNKYLTFKDFCIAYHILLSTVCKYYLVHVEGHTEGGGVYFIYISLERLSYSASAVCYIKFHEEMTEILQVKDCSFYIQWCPCFFDLLCHILSLNIHII